MDDEPVVESKNHWKGLRALFWIALIGYGILYALSMIDFSFLKGEISAYGLECEVKPKYNTCLGRTLFAMRSQYYKPNKERQEVLTWTAGFPPDRLTKCAVVDRKNWKCQYNDGSATFGFQNGEYFNYPSEDKDIYREYYVSRREWLIEDCEDSIFETWYCIPLHGILRGK